MEMPKFQMLWIDLKVIYSCLKRFSVAQPCIIGRTINKGIDQKPSIYLVVWSEIFGHKCCVFGPAFGCCAHPKAGQTTFFSLFQPVLFIWSLFIRSSGFGLMGLSLHYCNIRINILQLRSALVIIGSLLCLRLVDKLLGT